MDGLDAPCADFCTRAIGKTRPLEIGLAAPFADRVELGGADAI